MYPPPEKLNLIQKKNLTSHPLENLEHSDKKLNSLGIILIPRVNLKLLGKYLLSPPKKIPKKNIIPCKSFNHPEKPLIMKNPQPLHLKNSLSLQKSLTPSEKFSTP